MQIIFVFSTSLRLNIELWFFFQVMTEDARQSYHAVPRIVLSEKVPKINLTNKQTSEESDLKFTEKYLSSHRINLNVRQVH